MEPNDIQKQMLELSIKSGRRLMHDFQHLLDEVPNDNPSKKLFIERGEIWKSIFYPDNGMKDYLTDMHYRIRNLEIKLSVAQDKLREHGIEFNQ